MKSEVSTNAIYTEDRLRKIYDVCNKLFGDKDELFYSKEQIEEIRREENGN